MQKSFLPRGAEELAQWFNNFSAKLAAVASRYALTPAEVAEMVMAAGFHNTVLNLHNQHREYVKALSAYRIAIAQGLEAGVTLTPPTPPTLTLPGAAGTPAPGYMKRAASIGRRIKEHSSYTLADGQNLGLEGAELAGRDEDERPVLVLRQVSIGGAIRVYWTRARGTDALEIQVDRGAGWVFLAIDTVPDYMDTHTLAPGETAQWKYRAIYRSKDEQTGDWSDVATITVAG